MGGNAKMTHYANPSPAVFTPGATPAALTASYSPKTPSPNEGFGPYTIDSLKMGFQQLGGALSNDAAGLLDWGAGALGFSNPANQAAAQAAIAADPSIISPTSPNYQGAFIGPAGNAPGILSEPGLLASDLFSGTGIGKWILIGGLIWAAAELSKK
jgi:hypothetical protein